MSKTYKTKTKRSRGRPHGSLTNTQNAAVREHLLGWQTSAAAPKWVQRIIGIRGGEPEVPDEEVFQCLRVCHTINLETTSEFVQRARLGRLKAPYSPFMLGVFCRKVRHASQKIAEQLVIEMALAKDAYENAVFGEYGLLLSAKQKERMAILKENGSHRAINLYLNRIVGQLKKGQI